MIKESAKKENRQRKLANPEKLGYGKSMKIARVGDAISHGGTIIEGSPDVQADGLAVARAGVDRASCTIHGLQLIQGGSEDVLTNDAHTARVGDSIACGAVIVENDATVFVD